MLRLRAGADTAVPPLRPPLLRRARRRLLQRLSGAVQRRPFILVVPWLTAGVDNRRRYCTSPHSAARQQPGESSTPHRAVTATSQPGASLTTPLTGSPQAAATTAGTPRPGTTSAPGAATATPRPGSTGTAGPTTTGEYVVVSGDTLSGICSDKIRRPGSMTVSSALTR
jgi:hypothetical protein